MNVFQTIQPTYQPRLPCSPPALPDPLLVGPQHITRRFSAGPRMLIAFLLFLMSNATAMEKVSLQLRWDHQFQFAGYYAAQWQGYYKEAGFDVEIRSAITSDGKILALGSNH